MGEIDEDQDNDRDKDGSIPFGGAPALSRKSSPFEGFCKRLLCHFIHFTRTLALFGWIFLVRYWIFSLGALNSPQPRRLQKIQHIALSWSPKCPY